jgi:hypothetical protein
MKFVYFNNFNISSGKDDLLKGSKELREKGLYSQTAEEIFNILELSNKDASTPQRQLICSIYCCYKNEGYDLLSKTKLNLKHQVVYFINR